MTLRIQQLFSLFLLASLLLFFTNPQAKASDGHKLNTIVILGDSLSDNGNLYNGKTPWWLPIPAFFIPKSPYYEGRFSNGPVWADYFSNIFTQKGINTLNYAVGGSLINKHLGFYLPYTLGDSINHYFSVENPEVSEIANSAYLIWIGSNDYLQGIQYFSDPEADTTYAISTLKENIEQLIHAGAHKFIIMNLPDISRAPYNTDSNQQKSLYQLINLHNQKLAILIKNLQEQYSNIDMQFYDANLIFEQLITDPKVFNQKYHTNLNITNSKNSCWTEGYRENNESQQQIVDRIQQQIESMMQSQKAINTLYTNIDSKTLAQTIYASPSLYEAYKVSYQEGLSCKHPEQYIFWDRIHPTTTIHQVMALIIFNNILTHGISTG